MNISVAVMAHPKRAANAVRLRNKLLGQGFASVSITYDEINSEWETGVRALGNHIDSDWHIVLQDDAIISHNTFYGNVTKALTAVPERTLVSFYTGKVRPFPTKIQNAVDVAQITKASWLKGNTLYWGVGIAIPTEQIEPMLEAANRKQLKYDSRVGWYYRQRRQPVYYTWPSIVDHNYKLGSLVGNDYVEEPRRAHRYEAGTLNFNERVTEI